MYDELSENEKCKYRARRSYWKRKGLSHEDAEIKAASSVPNCNGIEMVQETIGLSSTSEKYDIPNTKKNADTMRLREQKQAHYKTLLENKRGQTILALSASTFYISIICIATGLLIDSSLEVFGHNLSGWGKAVILELGILGLATTNWKCTSRFKEIIGATVSKAILAFLVILSFKVLHTGVESERLDRVNYAVTNNVGIVDLIQERDDWQKVYDNYAINRITDRRDAMKEISRLNTAIKEQRSVITSNPTKSIIQIKSNTEMLMRAALLMLNILFSHKLGTILSTMRLPPLLEAKLLIN